MSRFEKIIIKQLIESGVSEENKQLLTDILNAFDAFDESSKELELIIQRGGSVESRREAGKRAEINEKALRIATNKYLQENEK